MLQFVARCICTGIYTAYHMKLFSCRTSMGRWIILWRHGRIRHLPVTGKWELFPCTTNASDSVVDRRWSGWLRCRNMRSTINNYYLSFTWQMNKQWLQKFHRIITKRNSVTGIRTAATYFSVSQSYFRMNWVHSNSRTNSGQVIMWTYRLIPTRIEGWRCSRSSCHQDRPWMAMSSISLQWKFKKSKLNCNDER